MSDFYERLGLTPTATAKEIKDAYRKVALRDHPDRNGGSKEAEDRFRSATEAYEVLRDEEKRRLYDRYGEQGVRATRGGAGGFQGFDISDALSAFMRDFGGIDDLMGRTSGPRRGRLIRLSLELTLEEVLLGPTKTLRISVLNHCGPCRGTGAEGGESVVCSKCRGTGQERVVQDSVFGRIVSQRSCPQCMGDGRLARSRCPECNGGGLKRSTDTLRLDVPKGVADNNYITLRGKGNAGERGGPKGNVEIHFQIKKHRRFERRGNDLIVDVPVTYSQAVLGAKIGIPLLEGGEASREIPSGTQSGSVLRLQGKGLPILHREQRGNLLARVVVWVPERLSEDQEELVRELARVEGSAPAKIDPAEKRGLWSRLKEALS